MDQVVNLKLDCYLKFQCAVAVALCHKCEDEVQSLLQMYVFLVIQGISKLHRGAKQYNTLKMVNALNLAVHVWFRQFVLYRNIKKFDALMFFFKLHLKLILRNIWLLYLFLNAWNSIFFLLITFIFIFVLKWT